MSAFTFTPPQEELFGVALHRDSSTLSRWSSLRTRYSIDDLSRGKIRRLLPLVFDAVRATGDADTVSDQPALRATYEHAQREHDARVAWLEPTLARFTASGIDTIVLKGVALAAANYREPALRPMVDVDLLVRPHQLRAALRNLSENGWTPLGSVPEHFANRGQEIDLRGPNDERLDLHWHLHPAFAGPGHPANDEAFFTRAVPLTIGAAATRMLEPTDLLLHLLVHGSTNGWRSHPLWVADVVTLFDCGPTFDAERFLEVVRDANVAVPVAAALAYVSARFERAPRFGSRDGDTPDAIAEVVARARPTLRQRRLYAQIASGTEPPDWLRSALGPLAPTYHYWATQTVTWTRRHAAREFPSWLADHWHLDGTGDLPAAVVERFRRRVTER